LNSTTPSGRVTSSVPRFGRAFVYRILDRTIASMEVIFGVGTLIGILTAVSTQPTELRTVETWLSIPVLILTVIAGVLLWRGTRAGFALSLGLQLFQIFPLIVHQTAVRYVAGFHWTPRFGGPRIWKPWGLEGTFLFRHDSAFPATLVGVNVVALVVAVYLVARLRRESPPVSGDEPARTSHLQL